MYVSELRYDNVGPIQNCALKLSFTSDNNPKPLILVGENGSGKSILLSNIVDSFYEIARVRYQNAAVMNNGRTSFYKIISTLQISTGKQYLCSHIKFLQEENVIEYIYKCGDIDFNQYKIDNATINESLKWGNKGNFKKTNATKAIAEDCFTKNIVCYFGPSRYEKPAWLGMGYHSQSSNEHLYIKERIDGVLVNPITASDVTQDSLKWLLDVIVDSRTDVLFTEDKMVSVNVEPNDLRKLTNARNNVELILSDILGTQAYFSLNIRNNSNSRFNIKSKSTNDILSPTLDSLSTGQLSLLNIFLTIIRYADNYDVNKSINIADIHGVVVIDEADLHLHANLQRNILPKLLKRFPSIQFIITTHSPLLLLGLEAEYGSDGIDIYQLPDVSKITAEKFSEFQIAYEYMMKSSKYHDEIETAINQHNNNKPLVVTEGASDWKHIKAAYKALKDCSDNSEIFKELDFELLEYEPKNSIKKHDYHLEMGGSALASMCEAYSKIKQPRIIIFIADNDDMKTANKLSPVDQKESFKKWGNGVYSCLLPVPINRKDTPDICIEHMYSDDEIKTHFLVNSIGRRLYIGNEFDKYGRAVAINRLCINKSLCGPDKYGIIDGSEGARVVALNEIGEGTNFALPKMTFAENVLACKAPFDAFNFNNFLPLFKTIKSIIDDDLAMKRSVG